MNDVLNFRRLFVLISRYWFENRKAYLLFFLSTGIFLMGWFAFELVVIRRLNLFDPIGQVTVYFLGLFLSGVLSAGFLFQDFSTKPRTINYLLLPASALEKLLCVLFYGVVLFFIGYTIMFCITDFLVVKIANSVYTIDWQKAHGYRYPYYSFSMINTFSVNADMFVFYPGDNVDLYTAFFPIQSAFLLGAIYFKRNGFFKTVLVLLSIWLIFLIMESRLMFQTMPPETRGSNGFTAYVIPGGDGADRIVTLPEWVNGLVLVIARFAITPALWVAMFFRLKEKEL